VSAPSRKVVMLVGRVWVAKKSLPQEGHLML
jgi:hypothetical protein